MAMDLNGSRDHVVWDDENPWYGNHGYAGAVRGVQSVYADGRVEWGRRGTVSPKIRRSDSHERLRFW